MRWPTNLMDKGLKISLLCAVLVPLAYVWCFLSARITPWWSDPGEWLKYANAIEAFLARHLGISSPQHEAMLLTMWDQGVFQYPPLFFLILLPLKFLLGPLQALKILGSILFALQPVPIYFLAKKITGSRFSGLLAAYATSLLPINVEMLGWGGYPNLFGLLLLSTNIFFTVSVMVEPKPRNIYAMLLTSALIPLLHHLTSGVFLGILLLWILFLMAMRETEKVKYVFYNFIAGLSALALYRVLLANPSQFVLFNEAAYYGLRVNFLEAILWAFKAPAVFVMTLVIASYIILRGRYVLKREHRALLLAWIIFPIIATQFYILGIAIDFNRVFFFMLQPIPLLIALPASLIKNVSWVNWGSLHSQLRWSSLRKLLPTVFMVFLSVITSLSVFLMGAMTVANVAGWYSSQDPYGDYEKVAALEWIKHNTPPASIFIADEYIGRWIEGYASRRACLYMEPRFLFIEGQLERYYVASSILLGDKEIRNYYLRVLDQAPYNMSYTPIICFWSKGEYKETFYVNEGLLLKRLENMSLGKLTVKSRIYVETGRIETQYINASHNDDSLLMWKTISVNEHKVNIIYESQIKNFTVHVHVSPKRTISLIEVYDKRAVIHTDLGKAFIETNAKKVECDEMRIKLYSEGGDLRIQVFMESPERNQLDKTLIFESSKLVRENGITHIALPRVSLSKLESLPEYRHLLDKFRVVYVNNKVIILEVSKSAD